MIFPTQKPWGRWTQSRHDFVQNTFLRYRLAPPYTISRNAAAATAAAIAEKNFAIKHIGDGGGAATFE